MQQGVVAFEPCLVQILLWPGVLIAGDMAVNKTKSLLPQSLYSYQRETDNKKTNTDVRNFQGVLNYRNKNEAKRRDGE